MATSPVGCCFSLDGARKLCWMIHTGCNLRCDHCAVFDNEFVAAHTGVRGLDDIDEVLAFISARGIKKVVVSGGEPTLSKWCPDVIARLAHEGVEFSMSTNATTLTRQRAERFASAGLRKATVSLDGATARLHDQLRGVGTYDRAIAGTALLLAAGVTVSVGTFLREESEAEIAALGDVCCELGVRRLSLFYPIQRGRFERGALATTSAGPAELIRALRPQRVKGLRVTVHAPRCDADDCPSGEEIFGAIGGHGFEHCVYKDRSTPRLAAEMLAA